jgi:osmotically-inducible protein OsmY
MRRARAQLEGAPFFRTLLPPFGWRVKAFMICMAGGIVLGGVAAQSPPWSARSLPAGDAKLLDLELSLRARQVLQDDSLADLNLGVSVRDRVATLWGTVPNRDVARRAEERLRQVIGLTSVLSQLHVNDHKGKDIGPRNLASLAQRVPLTEPQVTHSANRQDAMVRRIDDHALAPSRQTVWRPALRRAPEDPISTPGIGADACPAWVPYLPQGESSPWTPGKPAERTVPSPRLPLSPASAGAETPDSTDSSSARLTKAVDAERLKDERFYQVRPEVRGGVVYLRGTVYRAEHIYELARSVSRLPGVERVVLENIQTNVP